MQEGPLYTLTNLHYIIPNFRCIRQHTVIFCMQQTFEKQSLSDLRLLEVC